MICDLLFRECNFWSDVIALFTMIKTKIWFLYSFSCNKGIGRHLVISRFIEGHFLSQMIYLCIAIRQKIKFRCIFECNLCKNGYFRLYQGHRRSIFLQGYMSFNNLQKTRWLYHAPSWSNFRDNQLYKVSYHNKANI